MKTFYSSTFITIILAFLMFMGHNNQKVDVVQNPVIPEFSNMFQMQPPDSYNLVNVEVFDDLICAKCDDFALNTVPKIKNLEQETGKIDLKLYFIPDVSNGIYYMSAMGLKCAADQNKFWEMYQKIHENKDSLNKKSFYQFAKELELNADVLQECIKEDVHKDEIEADIKYASEKNITFRPSVIVNGYYLIGDQPFENIQKAINKSIKKMEEDQAAKTSAPDTGAPATNIVAPEGSANAVPENNINPNPDTSPAQGI